MTYLYIEPTIKSKINILYVLIIIVFTVILMNYIHIHLNRDEKFIKCNMYISYITGNIKNWWEKCKK